VLGRGSSAAAGAPSGKAIIGAAHFYAADLQPLVADV